jgi:hypothetical protein
MKQRIKPELVNKLGTWPLKNIAKVLNGPPTPLRDELRKLFAEYRASGPNLIRMMAKDEKLERKFREHLGARYVFTTSGFADIEILSERFQSDDYHRAFLIFSKLIINKDWAKLDGPCSWCSKYFVRKRRSFRKTENVYCSRECSTTATATASQQEKRDQEYADKLDKAQAVADRWDPSRGIPLKEFVHRETGLTLTWIQQALNKGKLRPPSRRVKGRKAKS